MPVTYKISYNKNGIVYWPGFLQTLADHWKTMPAATLAILIGLDRNMPVWATTSILQGAFANVEEESCIVVTQLDSPLVPHTDVEEALYDKKRKAERKQR